MTKLANAAALAACNAVVDLIDVNGPGSLVIYGAGSGVPANGDDAITDQPVLAVFDLPNPAFGAAADLNPGARATANAISPTTGAANGIAAFFRALDGNDAPVLQGTVGTSGAQLNLNTTSIVTGVAVEITSWTHTQPESAA